MCESNGVDRSLQVCTQSARILYSGIAKLEMQFGKGYETRHGINRILGLKTIGIRPLPKKSGNDSAQNPGGNGGSIDRVRH